jgi:hypothetical protein
MLSRVFTSSALLKEPSRAAHELNAIGLSAKVAIMFGVNPMFLVNVSRVGFELAGTCSGFRVAVLGIVVFVSYWFTNWGKSALGEFQHIVHRTARLLRPVSPTLRLYGQQHDRHFVLGESELAGHRFRIETDHRRRTEAQRDGRIDHCRRADAYCLIALAQPVIEIQTACGDFAYSGDVNEAFRRCE